VDSASQSARAPVQRVAGDVNILVVAPQALREGLCGLTSDEKNCWDNDRGQNHERRCCNM